MFWNFICSFGKENGKLFLNVFKLFFFFHFTGRSELLVNKRVYRKHHDDNMT